MSTLGSRHAAVRACLHGLKLSALLASATLLAACETPPAIAPLIKDDSPERPTAVQESVVSSGDVNGLLPFEGFITVLTRPDMRRE